MRLPVELKPGEIINGSYRVLAKVGEGGMGQVYRVEHLAMGRQLALKAYQRQGTPAEQDAAWQRFQTEARTISKLSHRSIIQVYDFGVTSGGTAFYVMDFVSGKTLSERIRQQGQLDTKQALAIFIEVAAGLAYAHSVGLVHGDIKPSNIMLADGAENNASGNVKIVDFGLVKNVYDGQTSDIQPLEGSPPYMSPEQFQHANVDYRSDIYSFGCALFEALTGVPPFISDSALVLSMKHCTEAPPSLSQASLGREFPAELELIETRLLAKDPAQRYLHMDVVAEDLRGVLDGLALTNNVPQRQLRTPTRVTKNTQDNHDANEENTTAPQGAARAARTILFLSPIALILATVAIGATLGWRIDTVNFKLLAPASQTPPQTALPTTTSETLQTLQTPSKVESPPATTGYKRDSINNKTPFSEIVTKPNGQKMRVFHFPDDIVLGRLIERGSKVIYGVVAKGDVSFSVDSRVCFLPSVACCSSPSYFRRLRPDDLYEIDINNNEGITPETLNFIDHMTGLRELSVFATSLTDDAVTPLEQLSGLTELDVSQTFMTGAGLAKMKNLGHLTGLRVNELTVISPLLKALKKADKLDNLHLDGTKLLDEDLAVIASLQNLKVLSVSATNMDLAGLKVLSTCPALEEIAVDSNGLHPDSITSLKKFRHLKLLRMSCDNWSAGEIAAFKSAMAPVNVLIEERL